MQAYADHTSYPYAGPPGHPRRAGAIAVGLMAAGLLVAACSVPGQPQAQPSSSSSTSSGLAFTRCMRSHGVPDFPDPNGSGGFASKVEPGSTMDPASPQFQAAQKACKSLEPQGSHFNQPQQNRTQMLKYAQCMRAHGISDFPDPDANGMLKLEGKPGSDLAPDNPQFQAADTACKQYQPAGGSGGSTGTGNNA